MRKVLRALAAAVLLVAGSCRRPPGADRPVRIAVHGDPISLDPHAQNEILTFSMLANVYEALTRFDAQLQATPGLAAWWENPDETTWRFHLRTDARFHDGRPVEAADVVFSVERARRGPDAAVGSFLIEVDSVAAEGPHTVVVKMRRASAVLLNKLTYVFVVPRDAPDRIVSPIGSGPYRVALLERGKRLRLEKVAGPGIADRGGPSAIEFVPIAEPSRRADALLAGRFDLVQDLDGNSAKRVAADPAFRIASRPSTVIEHLLLSTREPLFRDARVRRAIHVAIDRRRLVEEAFSGMAQPASQMIGPGIFGYEPALEVPAADPALARRLLAEAGHPGGLDLVLEYRDGRRGDVVARLFSEAGIRVTPKNGSWGEVFARLRRGDISFYYGGAVATTADASDIFDSMAHTPVRGYGRTNFNGYSNAALDRLIESGGAILSMPERRTVLQEAMRTLMNDLWMIPLVIPNDVYGMRRDFVWEPRLDRLFLGTEMRRGKD